MVLLSAQGDTGKERIVGAGGNTEGRCPTTDRGRGASSPPAPQVLECTNARAESLFLCSGLEWRASSALTLCCRMLDYGNDSCCHESSCPDRLARASDFCNFDDATSAADLYTASGTSRDEFVDADAIARVDDDLYPVALHALPSSREEPPSK